MPSNGEYYVFFICDVGLKRFHLNSTAQYNCQYGHKRKTVMEEKNALKLIILSHILILKTKETA